MDPSGPQDRTLYDRVIVPFARDQALWPITAILLGHVAVFLAPIFLWVWRTGSVQAFTALATVLAASGAVAYLDHRLRGHLAEATGLLALGWLLGVGAAYLAHRTGFF